MSHTLLIGIWCRKKNRRIKLLCYRNDDDVQDFLFVLTTRRLIDFKTRKIQEVSTQYGIESFLAIKDMLECMYEEPVFKKFANVPISKALDDAYTSSIYINEELKHGIPRKKRKND